ncbi:hypothetical protein LUW77_02300 [Streptomyces radiopugnans]|nr:hypothetical protein LUW77_02300 [Streptomyces radiopugnans]
MLETPEAVLDALRENNDRPYGLPRTVTAEELVEAAEQFEDKGVLVTALLELMEAYEYTGEHRKSPVVFARLLRLWDDDRGAFSEWEGHQVYWRFKWVTTSLLEVPDVPLATVEQWIGRMRERYREAYHGMQPVAAMAHRVALHTGSGLESAYDLWVTRPRERLSDCEACETRHRALHHVLLGEDEQALRIWEPLFAGAVSCQEEPYVSHAFALLPLLRTGRADEARSHHLAGYRYARGKTGMAEEIGLHLEFCALTRNEGRGLEILAENRELFGVTGAPKARLAFLTGVQVLLGRLVAQGYADTPVAGPPGRQWTARTLNDEIGAEADALAAAFDRRNGTAAVGERRRARLERHPLLEEPLALGLRVTPLTGPKDGGAAPEPVPAPSRRAPGGDLRGLRRTGRRGTAAGRRGAPRRHTAVGTRRRARDRRRIRPRPRSRPPGRAPGRAGRAARVRRGRAGRERPGRDGRGGRPLRPGRSALARTGRPGPPGLPSPRPERGGARGPAGRPPTTSRYGGSWNPCWSRPNGCFPAGTGSRRRTSGRTSTSSYSTAGPSPRTAS